MSEHSERARLAFETYVGKQEGTGAWLRVEQARIDAFADATLDHQFIHIDAARAALESPYGTTIAHGFLTLSLLPHLLTSIVVDDAALSSGRIAAINYGLDRVRFPAPVRVGARVRAISELLSVEQVAADTLQIKRRVTVEIEGELKPGCVAETLLRFVYA